MIRQLFQRSWPALLCILIFLVLSAAFFSPLVGGKKVMFQQDIMQATGMAKEMVDHKEKTGEEALWTNSMFSGMPGYQIKTDYPNNYSRYLFSAVTYLFGYDRYPITSLWMLMACFFVMLLAFKVNVWMAAAISIAYGFSTFNIIGIETGHANKIWTLMYAPLILAGIKLVLDRKYILGAVTTAVAIAVNIYANHPQITYYIFLAILIWMIVELVFAVRNKDLKHYFISALILLASVGLGILPSVSTLWTTWEYGKVTTRGGSEITLDPNANEKGLPWDYVVNDYSNGHFEVFTLIIPNFMGGPSQSTLSKNSEVYKLIKQADGMPTYWGDQRYTAGPYYMGAILCFLLILGLLLEKRTTVKWWLVISFVLALLLSMGKNSYFLYKFFFDYFPLFNKFRVPTMFISLVQITAAIIAALGIRALLRNDIEETEKRKKLNLAFYISGGLCLLFALLGPSLFSFTGAADEQLPIQDPAFKEQFLQALRSDRGDMMRMDSLRSLFLIAAAYGLLWALTRSKLKLVAAMSVLAVLVLVDLWAVDKRYMDKNTYRPKKTMKTHIDESVADKTIKKDPTLDYRVLNLSLSTFNDATTSYHHKSIGGYHGAKLRRYQETIENCIHPEIGVIQNALNSQNFSVIENSLRDSLPVLNMLNTKYIILNPQGAPLQNQHANGNAWFVKDIRMAEDPTAEILALEQMNTKTTAVIDKKWMEEMPELNGFKPNHDPAGSITLTSYQPNHLVYNSKAASDQLAVFSEIYYAAGWNAYVDGQPAPHFRSNFILRSMKVPAGEHKIEFKFEPKSYYLGEKISLAGSLILLAGCIGAAAYGLLRMRKSQQAVAEVSTEPKRQRQVQ